ncbi:hypothetical protein F2Q70_00001840 [Brassica cretica]|uniref:Uncharacterized protein n=1 Tax=Brassica cretica TaxID=69181 RepID=A0A8S9J069_BRACR|nr:hypothetical protein F2Q70_00001840 [Brassica cretica]
MEKPTRQWVKACPNVLYGKLINLIREALNREKGMGTGTAFIKHGLTLDKHGRPISNLLDQEMSQRNMEGLEMKCISRHDLEIN